MRDVQFAEIDSRVIENNIFTLCETFMRGYDPNFKLADGSPLRLFCECIAAIITQQNIVIDLTGKGNLLRYAGEDTIEDLGWWYGARGERLQASPATATFKYTLSTTLSTSTIIPLGTRITPASSKGLYFATDELLLIPAGSLNGEVRATCETVGLAGNGFKPGEIATMVDRSNPFVLSAVNITESGGGADIEDLEAYRERIRQVPESFSVAGPDGAYEFWAKTANAGIIDVRVWSPVPGEVTVVPLMEGGELPTAEVRTEVYNILSDKTRRPLTDLVSIEDPEPIAYNVDVSYWIDKDRASEQESIIDSIEEALEEYRLWQRSRLGRDILPSVLHKMIMNAGARRVEITSPVFTILEKWQIAQETSVLAVFAGLENE